MFSNLSIQVLNAMNLNSKSNAPSSSLGYNTNNKHADFPPLMNDGRSVVSSWVPESTVNASLKKKTLLSQTGNIDVISLIMLHLLWLIILEKQQMILVITMPLCQCLIYNQMK